MVEGKFELVDHKCIQGAMSMLGKIIVPNAIASRRRLPISESWLYRDVEIGKKPGENSLQFKINLSDVSQEQHKAYTCVAYTKDDQILEISKNVHVCDFEYIGFYQNYMARRGLPFIESALVGIQCLLGVNNLDISNSIVERFKISRNPSLITYDFEFLPGSVGEIKKSGYKPVIKLDLLQHKSTPNLLPISIYLSNKKSKLEEFAELCFKEIKMERRGNQVDVGKLKKDIKDENYRIMFFIANCSHYHNKDFLHPINYKPKKEDKNRIQRLHKLSQEIGNINDLIEKNKSEIFNSAELELDKRSGEVRGLEQIGSEWDFYRKLD